jgi:hypothetical protein
MAEASLPRGRRHRPGQHTFPLAQRRGLTVATLKDLADESAALK